MKKNKVAMLLLAGVMGLSCTACGGGNGGLGGDGDDVELIIQTHDLGHGIEWLKSANQRFMDAYKDKDYGNGKQGVYVDIDSNSSSHSVGTMASEGSHIYIYSGKAKTMAASGNLLELDEIVTEKYDNGKSIEDKYYSGLKETYKGTDNKYYTIPAYETFFGVYYDVELFDRNGYYFADPRAGVVDEGNCVEFSSDLLSTVAYYADVPFAAASVGKFYFVDPDNQDWETHKSVGPDGKPNTFDDGLPSSIYELIVLCEKMSSDGVKPVQIPGQYTNYSNIFMEALMMSLLGPEKKTAMSTLEGEVEVVTGFSDENLVGSIDYIKKPITKTIEMTEETGYYSTWQVERFYAEAFMQILENELFFADGSHAIGGASHLEAQENLIFSGYNKLGQRAPEVGMLPEGSYFWNEARIRGSLDTFYMMNPDCTERKVAYMPLPTNIANRVTGENETRTTNGITELVKGQEFTPSGSSEFSTGGACIYVNKRVSNDASVQEAVKDWLQFFYSDEQLSNFTADSGFLMMMNYTVEPDDYDSMSYYEKDLYQKMKTASFYRNTACATVEANDVLFARGTGNGFFRCLGKDTILDWLRQTGSSSVMRGFESQIISMDDWKNKYYFGNYPDEIEIVDGTVFEKKYS